MTLTIDDLRTICDRCGGTGYEPNAPVSASSGPGIRIVSQNEPCSKCHGHPTQPTTTGKAILAFLREQGIR